MTDKTFSYLTVEEMRDLSASKKPLLAQEHSETSKEAARSISRETRGELKMRVLSAIKKQGAVITNGEPWGTVGGLTDEEGIEVTGIPASTYRPRRVELVEAGWVRDSGTTRKTKSNRRATVWVSL